MGIFILTIIANDSKLLISALVGSQQWVQLGKMDESGENILLEDLDRKRQLYKNIFEECDTDDNGFLSLSELERFINSDFRSQHIIPRYAIIKIQRMADKNGDKQLDLQEFVDMIENRNFQQHFERYINKYITFLIPPPPPPVTEIRPFQSARTVADSRVRYMYEEYTCYPPPIFIFVISTIEFICFITDELTERDSTLSGTGVTAQIFIYDPKRRIEIWRFLTYMLVHIGYIHLVVNLIVQMALGIFLEMVHKWRIAVIYCAGVVAGCLAHSVMDSHIRLGGASGGVYSLLTAHIANVIMNWGEMIYPYIQLSIFLIIVCVDLGDAIYHRYYLNIYDSVGLSAHIGGAVAGLLVGIGILRNLRYTNTERYIWWAAFVLYIILMTTGIIYNICN